MNIFGRNLFNTDKTTDPYNNELSFEGRQFNKLSVKDENPPVTVSNIVDGNDNNLIDGNSNEIVVLN